MADNAPSNNAPWWADALVKPGGIMIILAGVLYGCWVYLNADQLQRQRLLEVVVQKCVVL